MKRRLLLIILFCLVLTPVIHAQDAKKPLIIDTDMAVDDWLAILYLLNRTDIDVLAITVSGTGEANCDPGMQNALNLALLAGRPTVPVTCGRETPLQGDRTFPQSWRDSVNGLAGLEIPTNANVPVTLTAAALITKTLEESDAPVSIVTLGPLTNLADALQAKPDLKDHIAMIYIMGGAVNVPGNLQGALNTDNSTAEWNMYVDPLAAQTVIASGAPVTLVALDATSHVPLTLDFYHRLQTDRTTPSADFVYQALSQSVPAINSGYLYFWDGLAAAIASDASVATYENDLISVVTDDGNESGRTRIDSSGTLIQVAINADAAQFERMFLNVLNGRDPMTDTNTPEAQAAQREANKAVVQRLYEQAWGKADFAVLDDVLDDSYLSYANSDDYGSTRENLESSITVMHQLMPDLQVSVEDIIADGDVVAARVVMKGTHTGGNVFPDVQPTGNPVTLTFNTLVHLSGGKIIEESYSVDFFGFFTSLGVIPDEVLQKVSAGS